jgi:hypothetical protein
MTGLQHLMAHGQGGKDVTKDPLIHGLLIRLPDAGTEWSYEKRLQWVRLFTSVLDVVYTAPSNDDGRIKSHKTELESL